MDVQPIGPGDADRCLIIGDGGGGTKLSSREDAGFSKVALSGTQTAYPLREEPDLIKSVKLSDLEPVSGTHISHGWMCRCSLAQFLDHYLRRPALLVD